MKARKTRARKRPAVLAGGNPRVAKADGNAPVQAYIARMPGWKRAVGARLDAVITKSLPKAQKAVKWNSPFYGMEAKAGSSPSMSSPAM